MCVALKCDYLQGEALDGGGGITGQTGIIGKKMYLGIGKNYFSQYYFTVSKNMIYEAQNYPHSFSYTA